ncbi:heavy metal-binding domain-containing protein [uncultured Methanobacterium sp.]|uniref:YbjQ family protein n=1 Tax=uncultured Methanobacterium sp. TaxID=176306 RepID=UPI002AA96381|nr:heavy metal-binding domain-containing protein [uncultured Methanobacterium sp.]
MTSTENKNIILDNRWAIISIYLGLVVGVISAVICLKWQLIIFGFNIMYIVSPLLAGFVENYVATRKHGKSTGAISALLTFILINIYGWVLPGWIFPKEPVTLSLITIIALILTIQAAFPIFVNHLLLVVVPGIVSRIMRVLLRTPSEVIQATAGVEVGKATKQPDELFLNELDVPLVSVPDVNGGKIKEYLGLVVGEAIAEENETEGRFSKIVKIIEPAQLDNFNLGPAKKKALSRMLENAESMGANGVVEVLIDFVSMGGLQGSVTIVTATATAVIFEEGNKLTENAAKLTEDAPKLTEDAPKLTEDAPKLTDDVDKSTEDLSEVLGRTASKNLKSSSESDNKHSKASQHVSDEWSMPSVTGKDDVPIIEKSSEDNAKMNDDLSNYFLKVDTSSKLDKNVSNDLSLEIRQFANEEMNKLTRTLELATKTYLNDELERRFLEVSSDLDDLKKN